MLIKDTSFNVAEGDRHFDLHSNSCDEFEIGTKAGGDVWLRGEMVGPDKEFLFNGRLFCQQGGSGTVIDNFPKGDVPKGWSKRPRVDGEGFELRDVNDEVVFGYSVEGETCSVTLGLFNKDGDLAAGPGQGGLVLEKVPATIGKGGLVYTVRLDQ